MITFYTLSEFDKDVKVLTKKIKSIPDDLDIVKSVLAVKPNARPPFSFEINNLGIKSCIIKVRKIASQSLKGRGNNSGLRLVYAYFPDEVKIIFIEFYHKNEQAMEDRERILKYFK
jgi:mRNA-degrading endonuclease RelE of RelBE toxin-antitoxin system